MDSWTPKYSHEGRWKADQQSIFDPNKKITWPPYMAECIVFWRSKFIKDFPEITKGPGWSKAIGKQLATLNQQCYNIANYFPHPDDEPLVIPATKNVLRRLRVMRIGTLKKDRSNVSKDEKYFVNSVESEINKLVKEREKFKSLVMTNDFVKSFTPQKPKTKPRNKLEELDNG